MAAAEIQARIQAIDEELAAMTSESPGGKPSYSIDGQSVQHTAYRLSLIQERKMLREELSASEGDWELDQRGVT